MGIWQPLHSGPAYLGKLGFNLKEVQRLLLQCIDRAVLENVQYTGGRLKYVTYTLYTMADLFSRHLWRAVARLASDV